MVASEDGESILEANFERDEKSDSLDGIVSTINVIAHEQVVRVWRLPTDLEQLSEIVELPMDVSANGDRGSDLLHVRLIYKDFFCLKNFKS